MAREGDAQYPQIFNIFDIFDNHANFQAAKSPSPCAQGEGLG
jgi:hypothetical protein